MECLGTNSGKLSRYGHGIVAICSLSRFNVNVKIEITVLRELINLKDCDIKVRLKKISSFLKIFDFFVHLPDF